MHVKMPLIAALALAVIPRTASAQNPDAFTVDHAIDIVRQDDPQLSPDGSQVLFTRSELDWEENERPSRLWIVDVAGGDARPFTSQDDDGSARWSPDGRWIAFLRSTGEDDDERRQIFLIRTDGGEARQLTHHPTSVSSFEWLPGSRRIVFEAPDSLTEEEREAREDGADAIFVNEGPNGQGRGRYSNLWWTTLDMDSAAAEPLTQGERLIGDYAVSPDGERVAFAFRTENQRNDAWRSELAVLELESREQRVLTDNDAPESRLAWSPDGLAVTFIAPDLESWELDQGNLYALDVATGDVRMLYGEAGPEIRSYEWTPDGRALHVVALVRTTADLYRLDPATGELMALTDAAGVVSEVSFSNDHASVAFMLETPTSPPELYVATLPGAEPRRLTSAHDPIRALALVEPELVRWRSDDGTEIEGLLYRPDGGGSGAFVLEIHGGPAGVFTRSFDDDAQILAAHGWTVLQPNVRGSTGYGDALLRGNMNDIGGGDFRDVMTGVDAMIERGLAHPDSMAVKGWSYGGILGGWTITQTDRFAAASLGAMVSDWPSEFGVGFNYDVARWYLGGDPWTNRELWLQRSAYSHVDQVETPTILFHGERDETDTMGQSMNFHVALRHFGVPTRFILFPREGHGIREPRHHRTRLIEELRWFERWVRGNEDWQAPERPGVTEAESVAAGN
ncbi:MAG: S9 family peptidase [Longimicrobiales bacterium]